MWSCLKRFTLQLQKKNLASHRVESSVQKTSSITVSLCTSEGGMSDRYTCWMRDWRCMCTCMCERSKIDMFWQTGISLANASTWTVYVLWHIAWTIYILYAPNVCVCLCCPTMHFRTAQRILFKYDRNILMMRAFVYLLIFGHTCMKSWGGFRPESAPFRPGIRPSFGAEF
jgi:hypothetical protein